MLFWMNLRRTLPCAALLAALCPAVARAQAEPFAEQLEGLAAPLMRKAKVPGMAVARIRGGELAWFRGLGHADRKAKRPVTADTVFNIGSISKCVAAWGLMRLVEAGEIELDAPVERYLTRWRVPDTGFDTDGVTLRRLLSHTAGLSVHGVPGSGLEARLPTLEQMLAGKSRGTERVRLLEEPGLGFRYSGGGYAVAQLCVEEVSGREFAQFMRDEVLEPLGMTASDYRWTPAIAGAAATPYDRRGRPIGPRRFTASAAAGLQTTAADLARFAIASMVDFGETGPVLARASIERMQSPAPSSPGYGLGYQLWNYEEGFFVGHGGANHGWIASLMLRPDTGDGLVLLTNGTGADSILDEIEAAWRASLAVADREAWSGDAGHPLAGMWSGGVGELGEESTRWNLGIVEVEGVSEGRLRGKLTGNFGQFPLEGVVEDERVRFSLRGREGRAHFRGTVREGRLEGECETAGRREAFLFVKEEPPPEAQLQACAGAYEVSPGHSIYVRKSRHLVLEDARSGETRVLYSAADGSFFAGPAFGMPHPVRWRVRFERDDAGEVVALSVERADGSKQDARRRRDFVAEELAFESGRVTLRGTLYLPERDGPHPAVVWVHGSGRATRTGAGNWPLFFTERGYAFLAVDKRGVGVSEGKYELPDGGHDNRPHMRRRAGDVRAAVAALRRRADVRGEAIGLVGGSQAGWVIPMAAKKGGIAFTVINSGGATALSIENVFSNLADEMGGGDAAPSVADVLERVRAYEPSDPDFRREFAALECPGLWLYGDLDRSNPTQLCVELLEELRERKGKDFTIRRFPRGNHGLMQCTTGGAAETGALRRKVPGLYATVEEWLAAKGFARE